MKIEIKISDVKRSGEKVSIKESFDSLEDARVWIEACIYIQARRMLQNWINEGMPKQL